MFKQRGSSHGARHRSGLNSAVAAESRMCPNMLIMGNLLGAIAGRALEQDPSYIRC